MRIYRITRSACRPGTSTRRLKFGADDPGIAEAFQHKVSDMRVPAGMFGSASAAARAGDQFLLNQIADVDFVLGGGAILSVLFYLLWRTDTGFLLAATLFAVLSDMPHVLHSSARVWLDPSERELHGRHYLISLAVVAAVVAGLAFSGHLLLLLLIWIFWQFFHVMKQHYGMINIYAAKAGYRAGRTMVKYSLFAACFAPFYYRLHEGMQFSDYVIFGNRLPFSNLALPSIPTPYFTVIVVYCIAGICVAAYVFEQIRLYAQNRDPLPRPAQFTYLLAVASYNASYLLVSDLYALILIAATVHSLQYHVICLARNRGRAAEQASAVQRRPLQRLLEPQFVPAYFAILFVAGAVLANLELVLVGIVPLTVVLHHFYLDSFLWTSKRNAGLAAQLGLPRPATGGATN